MALGKRIRQARKEKGWSQAQLAQEAGLPGKTGQQTIQSMESRDSENSMFLISLCKALGLSVEYALHGTLPKHESERKALSKQRIAMGLDVDEETRHALRDIDEQLEKWVMALATKFVSPEGVDRLKMRLKRMRILFDQQNGDPLLIDSSVRSVDFEGVYAFKLNGIPYVKKIERRPDASLWVIFDHKSQPNYRVEDKDKLDVQGKVLLALRAEPV